MGYCQPSLRDSGVLLSSFRDYAVRVFLWEKRNPGLLSRNLRNEVSRNEVGETEAGRGRIVWRRFWRRSVVGIEHISPPHPANRRVAPDYRRGVRLRFPDRYHNAIVAVSLPTSKRLQTEAQGKRSATLGLVRQNPRKP